MKAFFEEYGFLVLAAIVVVLLISMASPLGTWIKASVKSLVYTFNASANSGLTNALTNATTNADALTVQ